MNKEQRTYILLAALLIAALLAGVLAGQVRLFPLNDDSWFLLWSFRLPRVAFAAVNGAVLALAGLLYQIALRNPMADGFTTGAASSAAFGGCLAMVLWGHVYLVSASAIVFAAVGIFIVRGVALRTGGGERITLILAGIALSVVAGSGISLLKYFFNDSINTMVFWLMGGLSTATWGKAGLLCLVFALEMAWLWRNRASLALLFLDEQSAETSGVNVRGLRGQLFILTTVLVALSVSFCGVISFLGLMVPHAVRALLGHNIRVQLIGAPLLGAISLVLFDLFARSSLPQGGELPVGIVTSIAGGAFFFFLLVKRGSRIWGK